MGFYLLAVDALLGKLLLVAGQAVVVGVLQHEAPGANGLLATVAGEAVLVPTVALVLHLFGAWWVEGWRRRGERERRAGSSVPVLLVTRSHYPTGLRSASVNYS